MKYGSGSNQHLPQVDINLYIYIHSSTMEPSWTRARRRQALQRKSSHLPVNNILPLTPQRDHRTRQRQSQHLHLSPSHASVALSLSDVSEALDIFSSTPAERQRFRSARSSKCFGTRITPTHQKTATYYNRRTAATLNTVDTIDKR